MLVRLMGVQFTSLLLQVTPNPGGLSPDQGQQIALEAIRRGTSTVSLLVPYAFFTMIVLIVWMGIRQKQARMRARAELQKQLLDKFNSGQEFTVFLESEGGQRFLEELSSQSAGPLSTMGRGIVLSALGLGMLGLSFAKRGFLIPAVLVLALGAGFLISTAILYRLSRQRDQDRKLDRPAGTVA